MTQPGAIERLTATLATGWAIHPIHPAYPVIVHAIIQGRVVASGLADLPRPDTRPGFSLDLPPQAGRAEPVDIMIGETGILLPPLKPRKPPPILRVEDILAMPVPRSWINGACHIDASAAGMLPETIIDMLYRDYLGRSADAALIGAGLAKLRPGGTGFAGVRRMFLDSPDYRARRIHADAAPGSIFSQTLVMSVAGRDFVSAEHRQADPIDVSARDLLARDGRDFVAEAYHQLVRKEADPAGMEHYLYQLHIGRSKRAILLHLANEFEAIAAGVRLMDVPEE